MLALANHRELERLVFPAATIRRHLYLSPEHDFVAREGAISRSREANASGTNPEMEPRAPSLPQHRPALPLEYGTARDRPVTTSNAEEKVASADSLEPGIASAEGITEPSAIHDSPTEVFFASSALEESLTAWFETAGLETQGNMDEVSGGSGDASAKAPVNEAPPPSRLQEKTTTASSKSGKRNKRAKWKKASFAQPAAAPTPSVAVTKPRSNSAWGEEAKTGSGAISLKETLAKQDNELAERKKKEREEEKALLVRVPALVFPKPLLLPCHSSCHSAVCLRSVGFMM